MGSPWHMAAICAVSWGISSHIDKIGMDDVDPSVFTIWKNAIFVVALLVITVLMKRHDKSVWSLNVRRHVPLLLLAGALALTGTYAYMHGLHKSQNASVFLATVFPASLVAAAVVGTLAGREELSSQQVVGIILSCIACALLL